MSGTTANNCETFTNTETSCVGSKRTVGGGSWESRALPLTTGKMASETLNVGLVGRFGSTRFNARRGRRIFPLDYACEREPPLKKRTCRGAGIGRAYVMRAKCSPNNKLDRIATLAARIKVTVHTVLTWRFRTRCLAIAVLGTADQNAPDVH
jgi:hypothetical protein